LPTNLQQAPFGKCETPNECRRNINRFGLPFPNSASKESEAAMAIKLDLPKIADMKPRITVVGVGGAGGNAVNNMIAAGLSGVEFLVANTDAQALAASSADGRIQLGANLTEGLGAGSKPEIGEAAAEEALDEIRARVSGSHMIFIAAGMGGGTGTGAASVIARVAKEAGILVVGVVTKPFQFEGSRRMRIAEAGVAELRKHVDTMIVIPNQNLFRIANERTTFADAFVLADQVLYSGIACIVDLIMKEGLINLDLADVRTVLSGMGTAMMGTGEAGGERRAVAAAEEAISNPLIDDVTLKGAKGLLLSIIGGRDMTLFEVDEAASRVRREVDPEANIIVGATFDESLGDRVRVSIVASGMSRVSNENGQATPRAPTQEPNLPRAGVIPGAPPMPGQPQLGPSHPLQTYPKPAAQAQGAPPASFDPWGRPASRPAAAQHPAQGQQRDGWMAPGDVYIQDGASHLLDQMAAPRLNPASNETESVYGRRADGFSPSPPADVRRVQRRMPDVEDFPMIGQMEYRAKTNATVDPRSDKPLVYQQPLAEPKKASLFQRLTGAGRASQDARQRNEDRAPAEDLPVFFNRAKR
jgi:cell division protein FtsZ